MVYVIKCIIRLLCFSDYSSNQEPLTIEEIIVGFIGLLVILFIMLGIYELFKKYKN